MKFSTFLNLVQDLPKETLCYTSSFTKDYVLSNWHDTSLVSPLIHLGGAEEFCFGEATHNEKGLSIQDLTEIYNNSNNLEGAIELDYEDRIIFRPLTSSP